MGEMTAISSSACLRIRGRLVVRGRHSHILAAPERAFVPQIDWDAGFSAALDTYSASIVSPDLRADRERLVRDVLTLAPAVVRALGLRVAHRCWPRCAWTPASQRTYGGHRVSTVARLLRTCCTVARGSVVSHCPSRNRRPVCSTRRECHAHKENLT